MNETKLPPKLDELANIAIRSACGLMASGAEESQIQDRFRLIYAQLILYECTEQVRKVGALENDASKAEMYVNAIREYFNLNHVYMLK